MNAITYALKAAGVATPTQSELIWRRVKEQPGMTAKGIGVSLTSIKKSSISTLLSAMEKRGMVYTKRTSGRSRTYYTDMVAFELLPLPKAKAPAAPVPVPVLSPPPKPLSPLEAIPAPLLKTLENYKLSELRVIRDGLNFLFGDSRGNSPDGTGGVGQ